MNKTIYILSFLIFTFCNVVAQNDFIKISDNSSIVADLDLARLLEINLEKSEKTDEISGFRIQVASNNNRFKIDEERELARKELKAFQTYVVYDQPYYKLRLGNYKTRLEAMKYLHDVLEVFSSAFIVRDDIKSR